MLEVMSFETEFTSHEQTQLLDQTQEHYIATTESGFPIEPSLKPFFFFIDKDMTIKRLYLLKLSSLSQVETKNPLGLSD